MPTKPTKHLKALPAPKSNGSLTREAPEERSVRDFDKFNQAIINEAQFNVLYSGTPVHAIFSRTGRGGKDFRYIKHGYVTDVLNKAFGFGWSFVLKPIGNGEMFILQIYDEVTGKGNKQVRDVAVYGELTANVYNPKTGGVISITKGGMGSQRWEMGTEFGDALKGAQSDAKKNAAKELGIGLDLYYDDDAAIELHETRQRQAEELQAELEAMQQQAPAWAERAKKWKGEGKSNLAIKEALAKEGIDAPMAEISKWSK